MFFQGNEKYNCATYLRLSRSDGDQQESNSIKNQRALLNDYMGKHPELHKFDEYVDDGYSGTNFDRPGFQQMMDGVRNGKIDTIIVKDLSRFGRDYIGVGEYMEQIFPLLGVRLIAINDNYDSNNYKGTTLSCPCCNIKECVIIWATKRPERGHYESDSMAVKIGAGDDNPAADSCCVAGKMVCGISASLFGMVFLSAGQCAIGNGDAFVPAAAITGDGSTSNADWWIRDFYDTAGGRQRDRASGTGGSNASAGMVHIK